MEKPTNLFDCVFLAPFALYTKRDYFSAQSSLLEENIIIYHLITSKKHPVITEMEAYLRKDIFGVAFPVRYDLKYLS